MFIKTSKKQDHWQSPFTFGTSSCKMFITYCRNSISSCSNWWTSWHHWRMHQWIHRINKAWQTIDYILYYIKCYNSLPNVVKFSLQIDKKRTVRRIRLYYEVYLFSMRSWWPIFLLYPIERTLQEYFRRQVRSAPNQTSNWWKCNVLKDAALVNSCTQNCWKVMICLKMFNEIAFNDVSEQLPYFLKEYQQERRHHWRRRLERQLQL